VALILVSVIIIIDVRKCQTRPIGETPHLLADMPYGTNRTINLLAALNQFLELSQFAPNDQPDCIFGELVCVRCEITEHPIRFATTASATE
jgi:hypothetical protein